MIIALCFIAGLVVLARMSWPKGVYVPPRATVTSIIGGAIGRTVLIVFGLYVFLIVLADM